jgi:hypothetical protein
MQHRLELHLPFLVRLPFLLYAGGRFGHYLFAFQSNLLQGLCLQFLPGLFGLASLRRNGILCGAHVRLHLCHRHLGFFGPSPCLGGLGFGNCPRCCCLGSAVLQGLRQLVFALLSSRYDRRRLVHDALRPHELSTQLGDQFGLAVPPLHRQCALLTQQHCPLIR